MRVPRQFTIALILLLSSSGSAWPGAVIDIFQQQNQPEICRVENGSYIVDRMLLARRVVDASAIGPDLLRQGDPPSNVISLLATDEPFGSGRFAATPPALAATQRLLTARMELTGFLALGGSKREGYIAVNRLPRSPTSDDFFLHPNDVYIECVRHLQPRQQEAFIDRGAASSAAAAPAPVTTPASKVPNFSAAALARKLLVRGDILELVLAKTQVDRSKGASFSFGHDDKNGEDTFIGDGTIGWKLWSLEGEQNASVIPYFNYKSTGKQETGLPEYILSRG